MDLGFRGDVVDFYHRYRRGYPAEVVDTVVDAFGLDGNDVVIDLGCGTGQLTVPLARRVRAAIGMDSEPDMLTRAREAARESDTTNVGWLLGADDELDAVAALLGDGQPGAVTIACAVHWMDHDRLFRALRPLVRPGGGVAVIANGTPLWLQESPWSRALRQHMEGWLGTRLTATCGTDDDSRARYAESLAAAGFAVRTSSVDYSMELGIEQIVGGIFSALSVDQLPSPEERPGFADAVRDALEPHGPFTEHVHVSILLGTRER